MRQNRFFNILPKSLKTTSNKKSASVMEDVLLEPEDFLPLEGQIGDQTGISQTEAKRNPFVIEATPDQQKYQLSVCVARKATDGSLSGGAFYTDLVGQLASNGADVSRQDRLFDTGWYSWAPPFDADKWLNFQRYYWTGPGVASVQGEFITKEPAGSQTVIYTTNGSEVTKIPCQISSVPKANFPNGSSAGQLMEDPFDPNRTIYQWSGNAWQLLPWTPVKDIPGSADYPAGTFFYVCRTGHDLQRPIIHVYSESAGRWIAQPVIVSYDQPSKNLMDGMVWENAQTAPNRILYRYSVSAGTWIQLSYTPRIGLTGFGPGSDGDSVYDIRMLSSITDGWRANNWWRHFDDLSDSDKDAYSTEQATRPILEHWGWIETFPGSTRTARHSVPRYNLYAYDTATSEIRQINVANFGTNSLTTQGGSTIVEFKRGTGSDDSVIGFPLSYDSTGAIQFQATMESDVITHGSGSEPIPGYRFFLDTTTGYVYSIWARSETDLVQSKDSNGLWNVPRNLTDNADHGILTTFSRSQTVAHFSSIISTGSAGSSLGTNGYRWGKKDVISGATIIDTDSSLLRTVAILQSDKLDMPDSIRSMSSTYVKDIETFLTTMDSMWVSGDISHPDDTLISSVSSTTDSILSKMLSGRTEDFPFWLSGMGTYLDDVTGVQTPISFPPSPPLVGATPPYQPQIMVVDGSSYVQGHEGSLIPSRGDARDQIYLDLQTRFYNAVSEVRRTETSTESSRISKTSFYMGDWANGWKVTTNVPDVLSVVQDHTALTSVTVGERVYSSSVASYATWNGSIWNLTPAMAGDLFLSTSDGNYHSFDGNESHQIPLYPRNGSFDYTIQEAENTVRREFERWATLHGYDLPYKNTIYDVLDPFTWNYSSAGIEGGWRAIYARVYGTVRPHSCPWEILGFSIEPTWWRTTYVPTSTASDGTPRYSRSHPMWSDLVTCSLPPISIPLSQRMPSTAPVPVDVSGNLLDPIASGVVAEQSLVQSKISDDWTFGDRSPVEETWRHSPGYSYALALQGFLIKPARWMETLWDESTLTIGSTGSYHLWRGPISVNGTTLTRPGVEDRPVHGQLVNGVRFQNTGVNSWISERLNVMGASPTTEFGDLLQQSEPVLGWRTSGFINRPRTTMTTPSGVSVPYEDMNVVIHQSTPTSVAYHSGITVLRDGSGYRIYGYDTTDPSFTVELPSRPGLTGQATRSEKFIAQAGQTQFTLTQFTIGVDPTSSFNLRINGNPVDMRLVKIVSTTVFDLSNVVEFAGGETVIALLIGGTVAPSTMTRSFVIDGKTFRYYPSGSGVIASYPYGYFFSSAQDVVQFIVDHGRWMGSQGWVYDNSDPVTAAQDDWLSVAQRFMAWALTPRRDGESYTDVAGGGSLRLAFSSGNAMDIEKFVDGAYSVVGPDGKHIPSNQLVIDRTGGSISVSSNGGTQVYGLRVHFNQIQHVVLISNVTKFNDLMYDPITGLRQSRLVVKTFRTASWDGTMSAPGYIISGNDLLPNFEKVTADISRYYSPYDPVDDPTKLAQARNLYNWHTLSYMDDLQASDTTSFAWYRNFLRYKGTVRPVVAYARGTTAGTDNIELCDDWAWKLSDFGYSSSYERVLIAISAGQVRGDLQIVSFVDTVDSASLAIQITPFDRNNPDANPQWILPPSGSNYSFSEIIGSAYYSLNILDSSDTALDKLFHWDPSIGLHEPSSYSQIDYESGSDPARYTDGPLAHGGDPWTDSKVGAYWWDTSTRTYSDYKSISDLSQRAHGWGTISKIQVVSIMRDGIDVTVQTSSPHGYSQGQTVIISGANQGDYNGRWTIDSVPSANVFLFSILNNLEPASPATGSIFVTQYSVDVYQWVKTSVIPNQYSDLVSAGTASGEPKDVNDPSYVTSVDSSGNTWYYYWVKGILTAPSDKDLSVSQVESMLEDPSGNGISWFSPISQTDMVFFQQTTGSSIDVRLELVHGDRDRGTHSEWTIFPEGSSSIDIPDSVLQSLLYSLAGVDQNGSAIPDPRLSQYERYGSYRRGQTIFRDLASARNVFLESFNRVMSARNMSNESSFVSVFDVSDESTGNQTGWWVQADYVEPSISGLPVPQIVSTISERDSMKAVLPGQLVYVRKAFPDPYEQTQLGFAVYQYVDGAWTEVSAHNATANLNSNIFQGGQSFVSLATKLLSFLQIKEKSSIVFACLYEMLTQHSECDWFFKTSFVDLTYTTSVSQPAIQPAPELPAIIDAVNDIKPFRTKLRNVIAQYNVNADETGSVNIEESVDKVITSIYDRVACNTADEDGWDMQPWDSESWDITTWGLDDLGRGEFLPVGSFISQSGIRQYVVQGVPLGYAMELTCQDQSGNSLSVPDYSVLRGSNSATISFTAFPLNGLTFTVLMSQGFVNGPDPSIPSELASEYPWMQPVTTDYEHIVARLQLAIGPDGNYLYPDLCGLLGCDGKTVLDGGTVLDANNRPMKYPNGYDQLVDGGSIDGVTPVPTPSFSSTTLSAIGTTDTSIRVADASGFYSSSDPSRLATISVPGTQTNTLTSVGQQQSFEFTVPDFQIVSVTYNGIALEAGIYTLGYIEDESTDIIYDESATAFDPNDDIDDEFRDESGKDMFYEIGMMGTRTKVTVNTPTTEDTDVIVIVYKYSESERVEITAVDLSTNTLTVVRGAGFQSLSFSAGANVIQAGQQSISGSITTIYDGGSISNRKADCHDMLGGSSQERVLTLPADSCRIEITSEHTPTYMCWDATPWDTSQWDAEPVDMDDKVYSIEVGFREKMIYNDEEYLPSTEDVTYDGSGYVIASDPRYSIGRVEVNSGSGFNVLSENIDYVLYNPYTIKFVTVPYDSFTGNGQTLSFTTAIPSTVKQVLVSSIVQKLNVDYTVSSDGRTVTFTVAPQEHETIMFVMTQRAYLGDQVRLYFSSFRLMTDYAQVLDYTQQFTYSNGTIYTVGVPTVGSGIHVRYRKLIRDRRNQMSTFSSTYRSVDSVITDRSLYSSIGSIFTDMPVGYTIMDVSASSIYSWNGSAWVLLIQCQPGQAIYVKDRFEGWSFDGSDWKVIYRVGSDSQSQPFVDYFWEGITSATVWSGARQSSYDSNRPAWTICHAPVPRPFDNCVLWVANHSFRTENLLGITTIEDISKFGNILRGSDGVSPSSVPDANGTGYRGLFFGGSQYLKADPYLVEDDIFADDGGSVVAAFQTSGSSTGIIVDKTDWGLRIVQSGSTKYLEFFHNFSVSSGVWTYPVNLTGPVVVLVNYSNSNLSNDPSVYINGSLATAHSTVRPAGIPLFDSTDVLTLGGDSSGSNCFSGYIYEIAVFNTVLTDGDLRMDMDYLIQKWM